MYSAANTYTQTQPATHQTNDKSSHSHGGKSLLDDDVFNITYKYKLQPANTLQLNDPSKLRGMTLDSGSPEYIQQYKVVNAQQALSQDTKAIINVGDRVVATYNHDGSVQYRDDMKGLISQASGDLNALNNLLSEAYGQDFSIETFEPGEGPTGAEVFEMFNGMSLNEYVDRQVEMMSGQYQQDIQLAEKQHKEKIMYEQVPQKAVFSVGGTIVGSINPQGYVDINSNILDQADAKNLDRELIGDFYSYKKMHDTNTQTVESLLRDVFGDDVDVTHFDDTNMPSLGDVRGSAAAKVIPF